MFNRFVVLSLWVVFSATVAIAESKDSFDPTSVKLDQMQNGITNILTRIFELEKNGSQSTDVEELKLEISNLKAIISSLEAEISNSSATALEKFDDLRSDVSDISKFQDEVKFQIPSLNSRLSDVEVVLLPLAGAQRVVKDEATNSAKIFTASNLGSLIADLPLAENCAEIGKILATFSDRSYNTAFVKTNTGDVTLCTYEAGRWQVISGDGFAPGHMITAE